MILNIPMNISDEIRFNMDKVLKQLEEASCKARSKIISPTGVTVWEEPLDKYLERMEKLND